MAYAHAKFEVATCNGLGGENIYKKIHYLTFDLDIGSHKSSPVPSTSCDPLHMHSLKLIYATVWEEMHLQEFQL